MLARRGADPAIEDPLDDLLASSAVDLSQQCVDDFEGSTLFHFHIEVSSGSGLLDCLRRPHRADTVQSLELLP